MSLKVLNSRYIWLPIKFNGDSIDIGWQDEWDVENGLD